MKTYGELCSDPTATALELEAALLGELLKCQVSRDFYRLRCERLQEVQSRMRDPERTWVCNILANGRAHQGGPRPIETVFLDLCEPGENQSPQRQDDGEPG